MLNSEKMSKSTGNFCTLRQAIKKFSSDATRFSLADAGDGMDDANFVFDTANAAILRLTKEITWMEGITAGKIKLRSKSFTYADKVFANEINIAVKSSEQSYDEYLFREALKAGYYDLQAARDEYRLSCELMHKDLLWRFMEVQTKLITPICPHYAEYAWKNILKKEGFVVNSGFPKADSPDFTIQRANKYLQDFIVSMRKLLQKQTSDSKKPKKDAPVLFAEENNLTVRLVYVNEQYDGWKKECLGILQSKYNSNKKSFASHSDIVEALERSSIGQDANFKQIQKLCMSFLKFKKDDALSVGLQALDLKQPFGEIDVLSENIGTIKRQLGLEHVEILNALDPEARKRAGPNASLLEQNPPSPGNPTSIFLRMSAFNSILP